MAKIIHCPTCGAYYNGTSFNSCPYCRENRGKGSDRPGFFQRLRSTLTPAGTTSEEIDPASVPDTPAGSGITRTPADSAPAAGQYTPDAAAGRFVMPHTEAMNLSTEELPIDHNGAEDRRPQVMPMQDPDETEEFAAEETFAAPAAPSPSFAGVSAMAAGAGEDFRAALKRQIRDNGRTVGRYLDEESEVRPVAGWLACIRGTYRGQSFPIHKGRNRIGRGSAMDIDLADDRNVSRSAMAVIHFDPRADHFLITEGESDLLVYVNGEMLCGRRELKAYDTLEFGDAGNSRFHFVPLCGEHFRYAEYEENS